MPDYYGCTDCGRPAPALDSVAFTAWEGGDLVYARGENDPLMLQLVCPTCKRLRSAGSRIHRLTLDTNVLLEWWKQQDKRLTTERLLDLAKAGTAELAVTRYIHDDVPLDPLAQRIRELPELDVSVVGGVFQLHVSRIGGTDGLGDEAFVIHQADLVDWRPSRGKVPDSRDWLHLHAHYIKGRDAFLTWDLPLRELCDELGSRGIFIGDMAPEDYLRLREELQASGGRVQ